MSSTVDPGNYSKDVSRLQCKMTETRQRLAKPLHCTDGADSLGRPRQTDLTELSAGEETDVQRWNSQRSAKGPPWGLGWALPSACMWENYSRSLKDHPPPKQKDNSAQNSQKARNINSLTSQTRKPHYSFMGHCICRRVLPPYLGILSPTLRNCVSPPNKF